MKRTYILLLLIVLTLVLNAGITNQAYAVPSINTGEVDDESLPAYQDPQPVPPLNPWLSLLRVVLSLGIVFGLIFWLRKMIGRKASFFPQGKYLSLVDGIGLGANKGIYLAKLENKFFLLGVTEQQINLLGEFEDDELNQIVSLNSFTTEKQVDLPGQEFKNFFQQQLERLKKISDYEKKK